MVSNLLEEAEKVRQKEGPAEPAFKQINPRSRYDRDTFIKQFKQLKDVRGDYKVFTDNEEGKGYEALQKLGKRIWDDKLYYFDDSRFNDKTKIDLDIRPRIDASSEAIDWHIYYNRHSLVNVIETDEQKKPENERKFFKDIALGTKGFLTAEHGTDEHDNLVRIIQDYQKLNNLAQSEDPNAYKSIATIVSNDMKKKDPIGAASGSLDLALRNKNYVIGKFSQILKAEQKVINKILTPEKAREYVLKNMEMAEQVYEEETYDLGDQDDLKKMAWQPILEQIAPRLYKIAKKEADDEKDKNNIDKHKDNLRAARRIARGFPL